MNTIWQEAKYDIQSVEILEESGLSPLISRILSTRKLHSREKVQDFLNLSLKKLHDPFLLPGIQPAINRIVDAIQQNERIFVWGDYDVDGITATATVITALKLFGANFEYHVPHRQIDGYDIKEESVVKVKAKKAKLLITVDCGILAFAAAEKAKEIGLDLIITDHHTPSSDGKIPDCIAVINPKLSNIYPFDGLAGVGIAFKVMCALAARLNYPIKTLIEQTLDLVALGTVADMAPMIDENRILVHHGCKYLNTSKKLGVNALLKVSRTQSIDSTNIGFTLGPRINAVGRIADPITALNLLICTDENDAIILAQELEQNNLLRQKVQERAVKEAITIVNENYNPAKDQCIVLAKSDWPAGVVGLVSAKLAEIYNVPSLVAQIKDDHFAKGSCRSAREINILECLKHPKCFELFKQNPDGSRVVGGHGFAAGFTIHADNIDLLRTELSAYIKEHYSNIDDDVRIIKYDGIVMASDINKNTINTIKKLAPFGNDNKIPILLLKKQKIESCTLLSNEKHLKFVFSNDLSGFSKHSIYGMWWQQGARLNEFTNVDYADILFKFDFSSELDRITIFIEDIKPLTFKNNDE